VDRSAHRRTVSTLNPGGTCGLVEAGLATTRDTLAAEGVAPGFGRSSGLIRRTVPGLSRSQSPKASCPRSVTGWAFDGPIVESIDATPRRLHRFVVLRSFHSLGGQHGQNSENNTCHPSITGRPPGSAGEAA